MVLATFSERTRTHGAAWQILEVHLQKWARRVDLDGTAAEHWTVLEKGSRSTCSVAELNKLFQAVLDVRAALQNTFSRIFLHVLVPLNFRSWSIPAEIAVERG